MSSESPPAPPSTVVFFAWMGASPQHIAKYTSGYQTLYPSAQIITITSSWADFTYRPHSTQERHMQPVVRILLSRRNEPLLAHAMSNGGANQLTTLATAYLRATGSALPIGALVLDSAPGRATFWSAITTFQRTLPGPAYLQLPLYMIAFTIVSILWLLPRLTGSRDVLSQLRLSLNDSTLIPLSAPRCYIYSDTDETIQFADVEEHAANARQKGWEVSMERFNGSPHVGHMRLDKDRYWKVITGLWGQREK